MDTLATGPGDALKEEELGCVELEAMAVELSAVQPCYLSSVTAVVSLVIMLRTVTFSMTSTTTVGKVATLPKTVPSLSKRESIAVTPVADQAIWLVIETVRKSRSATLAAKLATFKKTAPKSSAIVARLVTWPPTVERRVRSTASAVVNPDI